MDNNKEQGNEKTDNLLPLINSAFVPGECKKTIEAMDDPDRRELAWANYYQQTGDAGEAIRRAKPYMEHTDPYLRASACITTFFSSLSVGDDKGASEALDDLDNIEFESSPFGGKLFAETIKNMIFSTGEDFVLESESLNALPEGIRYYISYFYSLHELLRGRTKKAIGIAESSLIFGANKYPITAIYLNVILGGAYTFLKDIETAQQYYKDAWDKAFPDRMLLPFVQQSLMVFGFDRKYIKENHPEEYKLIGDYTKRYLPAWGSINDSISWFDSSEVSRTELVVGVLFKHNFSVKEIADLLMISANIVKSHLQAMREKTGASKRSETLKIDI